MLRLAGRAPALGRSLAHDVEHEPGGDSRDDAAAAISQKLTRPDGEIRASRVIGAGDRGGVSADQAVIQGLVGRFAYWSPQSVKRFKPI